MIAANLGIEEFLIDRDPEPPWIVYMFPHGETILLGGTLNDEGDWDLSRAPRWRCGSWPSARRSTCAEWRSSRHCVRPRPCRPAVRLESEPLDGGVLWHTYGHGGAGISLSWGCAAEITRAVLG